MLLAVGPQLVAINPNEGTVLGLAGTSVLDIAPRDLTFVFDDGQVIDPSSLDGIRIFRSGFDGDFSDSVGIQPGFVGIGESRNEVVVRFSETLPDDLYRVEIVGSGPGQLQNILGDPFNDGVGVSIDFELDLGAQVVAVVPQPISRDPVTGVLSQARDQIVVYFNDDDLLDDITSAENPAFYQLIFTNDTVTNTDDGDPILPIEVNYDSAADTAVLTFASAIDELSSGPGTYRLRIGTDEAKPEAPSTVIVLGDTGSTFDMATDLGLLATRGKIFSSEIDPNLHPLEFPGAIDEPGHRDITAETHLNGNGDQTPGITTLAYNFKDVYGQDPAGNDLHNLITENQKQRAREIFELYGHFLGVQFFEAEDEGLTIVTGDLRALDPEISTGPGGTAGLAGDRTAIMDAAESWRDAFGENWFRVAMHEIGHLLGLGHSVDLPPLTIQGSSQELAFGNTPEGVFPGDHDIVHGQHLHRPESNDIDLYQFEVEATGLFSAETIAERRINSSLLDTALALYRVNPDGSREVIARNDDYFSEDSFIEMELTPGTYFVGVSSTGNIDYNPTVENSGFGGTSEGGYDLRLNFRPLVDSTIVDATGTSLDGDADGVAGGTFNFWFRTVGSIDPQNTDPNNPALDQPKTIIVDKSDVGRDENKALGSLLNPFRNIDDAFNLDGLNPDNHFAANPGDIVRIVGNGGDDGSVSTLGDNLAYELGFGTLNQPSDGTSMEIPKGVTVMIDAGAILKLRRATVSVGSSSPAVDRSQSALQVLGTPDANVIFTSFNDDSIGVDTNQDTQPAAPGDWGGLIFRSNLDRASGRFDYEAQGIFLNYVGQADIRFGGGNITIDSVDQVINSITIIDSRPTVAFNSITLGADAAISATQNSFEETNFHDPRFQDTVFTSDYRRVGPDIHGNRLVDNTTNGLFVRISTPVGNQLELLSVSARWDDTDIVHVVEENVIIEGTPGGPILNSATDELRSRLDARLAVDPGIIVKLDGARIETMIGAQFIAEGREGREVILTSLRDDRFGAGGTFDTNSDGGSSLPLGGDWGGIYLGPAASASIDHALLAFGGGLTTLEGAFASFNVIEIHQADARITNSIFERNASGTGGQAPAARFGRGSNVPATIFVRGAQPVIVDNILRDNSGSAISINANSLNHFLVADLGRTTGAIDRITEFRDNQGPLIRDNRLDNNDTNGMQVRGATLTTQGVWDDTDIVHVLTETIVVPDFHTFGGLRLASSPTESLVVKLQGENAGFTATGRPLDIDDRIGGAIQIIGQPGFPVVLTSLADDTVGAGFRPDGTPQTDTDNVDVLAGLPTGPEVDNDTLIDNDVAPNVVGHFSANIQNGGRVDLFSGSGVTVRGANGQFDNADFIFDFLNFVDVGIDGNALELSTTTITMPATLIAPDVVASEGEFTGDSGTIRWRLESRFDNGTATLVNTLTLDSDAALGDLRFISYLDEDVFGVDDDLLLPVGTPGEADFRAFTLDGVERVGFSHGGFYLPGPELENATYDGWTADQFPELLGDIQGAGTAYTVPGNIDVADIVPFADPDLGDVFGLADVTTAFGWTVDPTATTATITSFLELVARDPAAGEVGDWRSIRLEQFSHDRNVDVISELEPADVSTPGPNATPDTAQFLGGLAPNEKASDENLRLGFELHGFLSDSSDVDVYSFTADAGTEVWLDIDRTSQGLDTVVELVDANGRVLARSDNSLAEGQGIEPLFSSVLVTPRRLQKSPFLPKDNGSTNLLDAGMSLNLPGPSGTTNTYHVRVRSSGPDLDGDLFGGETSGAYQLQFRLQEIDEIPGSTVRFADIRFATNGIEILGQPIHSPLVGEVAEDGTNNNTIDGAQFLGNLLTTDRATLSIAGGLDSAGDVDWYRFDINFDSVQEDPPNPKLVSVIFDMDYADGLANANTFLSIFDVRGNLIFTGSASGNADDLPAPLQGADVDDLSRGSVGTLDPFIGPVSLPVDFEAPESNTFFVAVTSNAVRPESLHDQFLSPIPSDPLTRLEPIEAIVRIGEDHLDGSFSTFEPPIVDTLLDEESIVPFHLGDVTLFLHQKISPEAQVLHTVDPFTGAVETTFPSTSDTVDDIAMRPDGGLFGLSVTADPFPEAQTGNFLQFDTGNGTVAPDPNDDGILTFEEADPVDIDNPVLTEAGLIFNAITFADFDTGSGFSSGVTLFGVGSRLGEIGPGVEVTDNILIQFNSNTGLAGPPPLFIDLPGPGLSVRQVGVIDTEAGTTIGAGFALTIPDGMTIADGETFTVEVDGPQTFTFEFDNDGASVEDNIAIRYDGTETADELAQLTLDEVEASGPTGITRMLDGNVVNLFDTVLDLQQSDSPTITVEPIDEAIGEVGPGGTVTGIAFIDGAVFEQDIERDEDGEPVLDDEGNPIPLLDRDGNPVLIPALDANGDPIFERVMYAVDDAGGLYRIIISSTDATTEFIKQIKVDGSAVRFTGLSAGPPTVEDGAFKNTLFAVDRDGNIHALDTAGNAQRIFVDGQSIIATGLSNADGLAFSTLDRNLWHVTETRGSDPGHGLDVPVTLTRDVTEGGASFYFGNEAPLYDPITNPTGNATRLDYNFPGGAHGSLITRPFDLSSYSRSDAPFLYFNYFLDTENANFVPDSSDPTLMRDSFRVFVTDDSGVFGDDLPRGEWVLLATNDSFRDANELDEFDVVEPDVFGVGGSPAALLRLPDSESNFGEIQELFDGVGPGFTLTIPAASAIPDGETFTVVNVDGDELTFEFDSNAAADPANIVIALLGNETAEQVASIAQGIVATAGLAGISTIVRINELNLIGADDVTVDPDPGALLSEPFTASGGWRQARIPLGAFAGSDSLRLRFDFSSGGSMSVGDVTTAGSELRGVPGEDLRDGDQFIIDSKRFEFDLGFTLVLPTAASIVDGDILTLKDANSQFRTFEFDKDGMSAPAIGPGFTLTLPAASDIPDGETFTLTDGDGVQNTFEFDRDAMSDPANIAIALVGNETPEQVALIAQGIVTTSGLAVSTTVNGDELNLFDTVTDLQQSANPSISFTDVDAVLENVPIAIDGTESVSQLAALMQQAFSESVSGLFGIVTHMNGNRMNLDGVAELPDGAPASIPIDGEPGGSINRLIRLRSDASATEVAQRMRSSIASAFGGPSSTVKIYQDIVRIIGHPVDDPGPLGLADHLPGDEFGAFVDLNNLPTGVELDEALEIRGQRGLDNIHEGVYIDDLVIGFAGRGEMVVDTSGNTTFVPNLEQPANEIVVGEYQLEIRRAEEFGEPLDPDPGQLPAIELTKSFDINSRFVQGFSLFAPSGADVSPGQTFAVSDGIDDVTFEFIDVGSASVPSAGNVRVSFSAADTAADIAAHIVSAINSSVAQDDLELDVFASSSLRGNRVDLFGDTVVVEMLQFESINVTVDNTIGDRNRFRDQGQILIQSTTITNSAGFGILVEDGDRDIPSFRPLSGPVRNLLEINNERLTPGVTIFNNVIAFNGEGGILFKGDPNGFLIDFNDIPTGANPILLDSDTFEITDMSGVSVVFAMGGGGGTNIPIGIDNDPLTPLPTLAGELASALVDAINDSVLNVTAFLGINGELFVEGAVSVNEGANDGGTSVGEAQKGGVPFARIVNNTIYGRGGSLLPGGQNDVGILIKENASPTLLNNIIANFAIGIEVDDFSQTTVLGGTLFQGNLTDTVNFGRGDFAVLLNDFAPLFVNPAELNFYLASGSQAIDSAIDALQDRVGLVTVKDPLGIALSPILAPTRDVAGQLRVDDPSVEPPAGLGDNVFKDRGALDRADFVGPSAVLVDPRDNDGNDVESAETIVVLPGAVLNQFAIQLVDGVEGDGIGVSDSTVTSRTVTLTLEDITLEEGVDYTFGFDTTNDIILLKPLASIWVPGSYVITLDNSSSSGIRDLADNTLKPNQLSLETQFTIVLGERLLDYGDAPAPYPTLLASDGARHKAGDLFLGDGPDIEADGQPSLAADADRDDGVVFDSTLLVGNSTTFVITASSSGFLDGWIDFNRDGDWDDSGERIFDSELLVGGENSFGVNVPPTAVEGTTYARFRFSGIGGLLPTGEDSNGEVEDYQLTLEKRLDFGDAPLPYPTLLADDGARHIVSGPFLGDSPSIEGDGQPSPSASDDTDDGVSFGPGLQVGLNEVFTVTASQESFLDAWIDFNGDGDWDDVGEQIFTSELLQTGANDLDVSIPVTANRDITFARFRISSNGGLSPDGEALDGEVEDYQLSIEGDPWQHGDGDEMAALDVNGDGRISPLDALLVINELNNQLYSDSVGTLPSVPTAPNIPLADPISLGSFVDVTGDFFVTPSDALRIINHLNNAPSGSTSFSATGGGAPNRTAATTQSAAPQADVNSATVSTFEAAPSRQIALMSADPLLVTIGGESGDAGLVQTNATDNAAATLSSQRAALLASAIVQYDSPSSDSRLTSSLTSASDRSETSDLESLLSEIAGDVEEAQQNDTAHEAFFANFFAN